MSVGRQFNFIGNMRVDVPHLRSLDSSVAADFDALAGYIGTGSTAQVVRGFKIVTPDVAIGNPATNLQLEIAGAALLHPLASEAGTVFVVDTDAADEALAATNDRIEGAFTANAANYVGVDLRRAADDTTADIVMTLDSTTREEVAKTIPLARTLDFVIVISTASFSTTPHVAPVAKVTTDSDNNVTDIEDARQMLYRLGIGGGTPDVSASFPWPEGRSEGVASAADAFEGGDKAILSDKDWRDAVMTRLWEVGGGEHWYSGTSDRDLKVVYGPPVLPATGDNFNWNLGTETLEWASVSVLFGNGTGYFNDLEDSSTILNDGDALYVDIDRSANRVSGVDGLNAQVAPLLTLGIGDPPGSRLVIAWRKGDEIYTRDRPFEVERDFRVATTTVSGTVKLSYAAGAPSDPVVAPLDADGTINATATSNNEPGFFGTGHGTGNGVNGAAGATGGGAGVVGTSATAGATGAGVQGIALGISATKYGVHGRGDAFGSEAVGVFGEGGGARAGVHGTGGATNGPGVIGTGTGSGNGVVGTGGATNGTGVTGTGQGTGSGVLGSADDNVSAAALRGVATGATGGRGLFIDVVGSSLDPDTRAAGVFRNTNSADGQTLPLFFLHSAADGNQDGVALWTERITEDDVDFLFGIVDDSGAASPELRFDTSIKGFYPETTAAWSLGKSGKAWKFLQLDDNVGGNGGSVEFDHDQSGDSGPLATTAIRNTAYGSSICKAWAFITVDSAETVSIADGFNVADANLVDGTAASTRFLEVVWAQDFSSTNYIVWSNVEITDADADGENGGFENVRGQVFGAGAGHADLAKTGAKCTIRFMDADAGTILDLSSLTETITIYVEARGRQDT